MEEREFERIRKYVDSYNSMASGMIEAILKNSVPIPRERLERVFNEAVKSRELVRGAVIGYNLIAEVKAKLTEDHLLMEMQLFDTKEMPYINSEKIYTYFVEIK